MTTDTQMKPLTKALHTTRVVEAIAAHLIASDTHTLGMAYYDARSLLGRVCGVLGNLAPVDGILYDQCLTAVWRAIDRFTLETNKAVAAAVAETVRA